jgi:hypothetical protein
MKYAMVALRGAWVSGGIEWNFPDGHTLTTVAPIDYVIRTEQDGSAALLSATLNAYRECSGKSSYDYGPEDAFWKQKSL